jgi:hypothetical protein
MSVNKLSSTLKVVLGEVDVLKSILTSGLPMLSGSFRFNVRGGGADQNLILLDRQPF